MHLISFAKRGAAVWGVALAFVAAPAASAQSRVVVPAGTVIIVRTTAPLQSATAKTGQTFETNVEGSVGVDQYTVIPSGSTIRGVVRLATPATRQQSGVIEVVFDRLTLPSGAAYPIVGKLTSTDSAERRQIESDPNARVVLVGERGGIGAAIAGAGSGKSANNILAALGGLLSEGRDVAVPAGTPLAVELESAITLRGGGRLGGSEGSTIFTSSQRVSAAQQALARLNYYHGPISGLLDDATRRALFEFQIDRGLSGTGNLDGRTAQALGLSTTGGVFGGATLSADQASAVRRDAQYLVARQRSELGASAVGRLDPARVYTQADLDLWFALSGFADNASVYEQVVRNGGNPDAAVLAGRALAASARRVDSAMQTARASGQLQNAWAAVRRQITTIDTGSSGN
ncbi:MAG TPA: peptidoglycan-binding domain-containing protein [Gemmatimonadaceae bacterium]|nr:peptidoglycan-binding domain-containing protein [Gemmatimonadaceae bacterium]